jgi:peptidoglycan-associated lipoprotein
MPASGATHKKEEPACGIVCAFQLEVAQCSTKAIHFYNHRLSMQKNFIVIALAALFVAATGLTGCQQRKPARPNAQDTAAMGQGPGDNLPLFPGGDFTPGAPGELTPRDGATSKDAIERGRGILTSVFFDFDRAEVRASERPAVEAAATHLKSNPNHRILLEGHCDWRGTTEYNLGLGDRRARSVQTFLQNLGITPDRIDIVSRGDLDATEGAPEATMARERRVEMIILGL